MPDNDAGLVHLLRLVCDGKSDDVAALARKMLTSVAKRRPDLKPEITAVLTRLAPSRMTRAVSAPLPVDLDSRLELLRREDIPTIDVSPIWSGAVGDVLAEVVLERNQVDSLVRAGLVPTRSLLFQGPPGTGKSLAACWLAAQLKLPLLTLDLSAVMSSFLGRTGNNIRVVLDYAKHTASVLLLDEFDAIAKRRDDATEIGELKRLVTVLLQEIDQWPSAGLLVAATNHAGLLDPAVWRRFDRILDFPLPSKEQIELQLGTLLPANDPARQLLDPVLADALQGSSFADVARHVATARRMTVIRGLSIDEALVVAMTERDRIRSVKQRLAIAKALDAKGISQRQLSTITGLSRDTMRRHRIGIP